MKITVERQRQRRLVFLHIHKSEEKEERREFSLMIMKLHDPAHPCAMPVDKVK